MPPIPKRPTPTNRLLTAEMLAKAVLGKAEAMLAHGLARTLPTPVYMRTLKGTDAEKSGTKIMYERRWSDFHAFCVLVGFYTCSLLLDRSSCPDRPIPVEPGTIRLYIAYMSFKKTEKLVHPDTQQTIYDVLGNVVYCTAIWEAPGNPVKFRAAMLGLDTLHSELTGPEYVEVCVECTALTFRTKGRPTRNATGKKRPVTHYPCNLHTDGARVRSRGCSMNAPPVKTYVAFVGNILKVYEKKGNIQLLPSEVRRVRTALLAENTIEGLQYWTMMIMGIKLLII